MGIQGCPNGLNEVVTPSTTGLTITSYVHSQTDPGDLDGTLSGRRQVGTTRSVTILFGVGVEGPGRPVSNLGVPIGERRSCGNKEWTREENPVEGEVLEEKRKR